MQCTSRPHVRLKEQERRNFKIALRACGILPAGIGRVRWLCWLLVFIWATAAGAETIALGGNHAYGKFVAREIDPGSLIDMRNSDFRVANSGNSNPDELSDCETGPLPINTYPLRVYDSKAVVLLGGRFDGEVPQSSEWVHTYCNSTAVGLWDSPYGSVEGLRARRVWDGIRFARASAFFRVDRVWLSDVRDDCIENDFLLAGMIKDSLFDGCFSVISMRSPDDAAPDNSATIVTLAGVLMRLQPYLYRGVVRQGFPVKGNATSPSLVIHDSVIAISGEEMINPTALSASLSKIEDCRNNLFLFTSDKAWPDKLAKPPSCFRVLQGEAARLAWQEARQNWIDCHFRAVRFADDTVAKPSRCDRTAFGGQY